jgi:hypothetical protein
LTVFHVHAHDLRQHHHHPSNRIYFPVGLLHTLAPSPHVLAMHWIYSTDTRIHKPDLFHMSCPCIDYQWYWADWGGETANNTRNLTKKWIKCEIGRTPSWRGIQMVPTI